MFRFIILIIIAVLYLLLTAPVLGILALIGRRSPEKRDRAVMRMVQWIFRVLLVTAGVKVTVEGTENIPADRAVLFAGNHRGLFDILVTYTCMIRETGFIAKGSLGRIPLLPVWAEYVGCLFFDRNDMKDAMQMILRAIDKIKNGSSVFLFPEGTRSKGESELPLLPFHEGSFRIATKTGCPVIPVAIRNTRDIWEAHLPKVRPAHVTVTFGKPVETAGLARAEQKTLGARVQKIVEEMLS